MGMLIQNHVRGVIKLKYILPLTEFIVLTLKNMKCDNVHQYYYRLLPQCHDRHLQVYISSFNYLNIRHLHFVVTPLSLGVLIVLVKHNQGSQSWKVMENKKKYLKIMEN